jgi:hypothetical protein
MEQKMHQFQSGLLHVNGRVEFEFNLKIKFHDWIQ